MSHPGPFLDLSDEVRAALETHRPVVALETSIVAQGLPAPHNLEAALGCEATIRAAGAIPATVAVIDGCLRVGLSEAEIRLLAADGSAVKVSTRDLGWAAVSGRTGATTVAATVRAAALAGIRFMATGGIGGVHRGHPEDQSADLFELATSPVAVFCAGAKLVLDIPRTLEALESFSVPVLGYGTDEVPGFYIRNTGRPVSGRVDGPEQAAAALRRGWAAGLRGMVVAVPPPGELDGAVEIVEQAVREAGELAGPGLTPHLLAAISRISGGRSLQLNVDLVINNAAVAAAVAVAFSRL